MSSQQKYAKAFKETKFKEEIIPVRVQVGKDTFDVELDEHPRLSGLDKLAMLKPAFIKPSERPPAPANKSIKLYVMFSVFLKFNFQYSPSFTLYLSQIY
jgi:acetyl-CoA acetyltransferase